MGMTVLFCVVFFQAEDGIRDLTVTGVQTCALPIYLGRGRVVLQDTGAARGPAAESRREHSAPESPGAAARLHRRARRRLQDRRPGADHAGGPALRTGTAQRAPGPGARGGA